MDQPISITDWHARMKRALRNYVGAVSKCAQLKLSADEADKMLDEEYDVIVEVAAAYPHIIISDI